MKCRLQLAALALVLSVFSSAAQTKEPTDAKARILSAKSVYFEDQIGDSAVRNEAVQQLKKWGRFQIAKDMKQADLILVLSADPRKGGYVVFSGGQTGTVGKNGQIEEDDVPTFNKAAPVRYALPAQTVDATLSWSLLAGVWNPRVFLGRWFKRSATWSSCACE